MNRPTTGWNTTIAAPYVGAVAMLYGGTDREIGALFTPNYFVAETSSTPECCCSNQIVIYRRGISGSLHHSLAQSHLQRLPWSFVMVDSEIELVVMLLTGLSRPLYYSPCVCMNLSKRDIFSYN